MSLFTLMLQLAHLLVYSEGARLKKCCPQHQQLFLNKYDQMECIDVKNAFDSVNETGSSPVWWTSDNLNFMQSVADEINILENMELTQSDFVFEQLIPCFKQDPQVLLIQSNVFIDVNRSELVLTQIETGSEYTTQPLDGTGDEKMLKVKNVELERHESKLRQMDEIYQKNTNMDDTYSMQKKEAEEVDINRIKLKDFNRIKIKSRYSRDVFCMDRVVFTTVVSSTNNQSVSPGEVNSTLDIEDEASSDWNYIILLCPCDTPNTVCVRKCCPERQLLHVVDNEDRSARCEDQEPLEGENLFNVDVYSSPLEPPQNLHSVSHYILHGTPQCRHGSYILRNRTDTSLSNTTTAITERSAIPFQLLRNSSILLTGSRALVNTSQYCIDSIRYGVIDLRMEGNILLCRQQGPPVDSTKKVLYSVCFIVGTGFLVLTLAVYAALPELRKSVHSWNIMAHIACSIVSYTVILVANLYTIAYPMLCILTAYILQISFLSSQLWLNAMCIDIACTFSGLRAPSGLHFAAFDRRKFLYYSAYTWGTTVLISGLTFGADNSGVLAEDNPLKPNFGVNACWFKDSASLAIFFYGPIGVLLVANLVLFHLTCWKINAAQKDTAITSAHRHVGGRTEDQTQLTTFTKLFLLMGVTWAFEIVSWILGGPHYLWYLTDLLNVLRGVFIFIILCCKRNVLAMIHRRLRHGQRLRGLAGPRPRTESNTSRHTSKSSATSIEHIALSRLNLSSTNNFTTIHQGRILEEESEQDDVTTQPELHQ